MILHHNIANSPPTISGCPPSGAVIYADKSKTSTTHTWTKPTASDPEQGAIGYVLIYHYVKKKKKTTHVILNMEISVIYLYHYVKTITSFRTRDYRVYTYITI